MPDASRSLQLSIRGLAHALGWRAPADRRLPADWRPIMLDVTCQHCGRPSTICISTGHPDPVALHLCGRCYAKHVRELKAALAANRRSQRAARRNTKPPTDRLPL